MIFSMTGYGRSRSQIGNRTITAELRSVNNRYFDCTVRCPRIYAYLEEPVKAAIKESGVSRGKVDVYIGLEYENGDAEVCVNKGVAEAYFRALSALRDEKGLLDDISVMGLASLPDVFTVSRLEEDRDALLADVLSVLASALEEYNAMRKLEGARLCADISGRGAAIFELLELVKARMPEITAEYRERLAAKMRELLADTKIEEQRLLAEAAIFAERIATDEETVRLSSHLAQLSQILSAGGAAGRKLDFLVQEINREINTIGSKAGDLQVTGHILEMKSELEKIREQLQNLE